MVKICIFTYGTLFDKPSNQTCYLTSIGNETVFTEEKVSKECNHTSSGASCRTSFIFAVIDEYTPCEETTEAKIAKIHGFKWFGIKINFCVVFVGILINLTLGRLLRKTGRNCERIIKDFISPIRRACIAWLIWRAQQNLQHDLDWQFHFPHICHLMFFFQSLTELISQILIASFSLDTLLQLVSPHLWHTFQEKQYFKKITLSVAFAVSALFAKLSKN